MLNIDISNLESQDLIDFIENNVEDIKNFELSIQYKADYSQSRLIRNLILFLFEKNGIDVPWKNRFSLISDELVNNSIEYGSLPLDKNTFLIRFSIIGNILYINLEVHDTGKGAFAKNSLQMENIRKQKMLETQQVYLGKRGRGLFQLVTNIVDELYFKDKETGGLIVGVNKKLELS
ncbi:MAG: hypothetical protein PHZ26_02675 [Candidatus Gracilibacteria bacterium]|nr:hypothetical protein [Candidatus Gracilibacteria bacterium]MDD2908637.1 hypothetical protein [Candidatus Gracilibacteria bacterium]